MTQTRKQRCKSILGQWALPLLSLSSILWVAGTWTTTARALPPDDDVPEEIMRTEIITEARSPIDGQPLTPAEYAALQESLQAPPDAPTLSPDIRRLIFLLQLRRGARTLIPFIP